MNIIVSAGGTGGHIYPALSIIRKLQKEIKDLNILYIGTHNRMEKDIVPKLGIRYEALEVYGLSTNNNSRNLQNIRNMNKAVTKCKKIMKEFKPNLVIGVGGYVTFPVIMAAQRLHIKYVIHEQNSLPGKTNRFLGSRADICFISYESSKKYFPYAKKVIYSGNPSGESNNIIITKESIGLDKNKKLLLIVSGSLGSKTLNKTFTELLSNVSDKDNFEVLYITGKAYYDDFIKDKEFSKNVKILPYLDNLSGLFGSVDLIISRAGASTISEILTYKLPSIIIPSPYVANNHQYYNALELSNKKMGILIEEKDVNAHELYKKVKDLLNDSKEYQDIKDNLNKYEKVDSLEIIYQNIKELINE